MYETQSPKIGEDRIKMDQLIYKLYGLPPPSCAKLWRGKEEIDKLFTITINTLNLI